MIDFFRITAVIVLVNIFSISPALAQTGKIQFHEKSHASNVDYHSFNAALMLKYSIEAAFKRIPRNPVLKPSKKRWDSRDVADPFLLVSADSVMLFYDGDSRDRYRIGYAVQKKEGRRWIKRGEIFSGSGGEWDRYHQIAPVVIPRPDGWRLYYNGHYDDDELGYRWGFAQRQNDGSWQAPTSVPMIAADSTRWDFAGNAYGDVLYIPESGLYKMWYTGFQGPLASIAYAESKDGVHWEYPQEQPVLTHLPGVIAPEVIFNGDSYRMFYVQLALTSKGLSTKIMQALSEDGLNWHDQQEVLRPRVKWEGKRLMRPSVAYFNGKLQLYYTAGRGGSWKIGAATTYATFQSSGEWASRPALIENKSLRIKYEQPENTRLSLAIVGESAGETWEVSLPENPVILRKGVFQADVPLPAEVINRTCKIHIKLESNNVKSSPIIYELIWVEP